MQFKIEHIDPPGDGRRLIKILKQLDPYLIPTLTKRLKIRSYAEKVSRYADVFYIVVDEKDCANCAVYLNNNIGYITSIGVLPKYQEKGFGKCLITEAIKVAKIKEVEKISLHVHYENEGAVKFYACMGFEYMQIKDDWIEMSYVL